MPTREDLHKLIDLLPEQSVERAHAILAHLINPPAPSMEVEEWRRKMAERNSELRSKTQVRPGMISGGGGSGNYDAQRGTGRHSFGYWDGDTFVQETLYNHKGHELTVTERLRIDRERLIYNHAVSGPGDKRDEREITCIIPKPQ